MPDPTQFDPDRVRAVLDHGEVVELDGGTLVLDGQESPCVVLRLAPWRARSVARVLQEWTSVSRIFHHPTRPHLDELQLSRTLELAAAALGGGEEPIVRSLSGSRAIPNRRRLAAVVFLRSRLFGHGPFFFLRRLCVARGTAFAPFRLPRWPSWMPTVGFGGFFVCFLKREGGDSC
jgi:hypothetical protein